MKLVIDIGNTRTKVGVFKKAKLKKKEIWLEWNLDRLKAFVAEWDIQQVALSTSAKVSKSVERYLSKHFYYIRLTEQTPLPIKNHYQTPKTLGKDRLAAVMGAYALYPNQNCLVIDAGTCITYDLLTKEGDYWGGNIAPGVKMRFQAMHEFTANLPLVDFRKLKKDYGYSTVTAMRVGGQLGAVLEMDGFIRLYEAQYGRINTILTGGDAIFFDKNLKTKIFVNHNLVFTGLNKILEYNAQLLE